MIQVTPSLSIPEDELVFTATRSSGPGGQNVNKVSTRITLLFDVKQSPSLPADAKKKLLDLYPTRINKEGIMRVVCQKHRSQMKNRELAIARWCELVAEALKPATVRKRTKTPRAAREQRLMEKKHRSQIKQNRSRSPISEWDD